MHEKNTGIVETKRPLPHKRLTRVVASVAGAMTDTVDEWLGVRYGVAKRWQVRD